jgi:hypothetical protein
VAVLTGDLIGSTKIDRTHVERTMDLLGDEVRRMDAPWYWPIAGNRFTRFRGDGWQMVLHTPHLALRHALFLMAYLRSHKNAVPTRIAIGIGEIESEGTDDLSDAAGEAFVTSGRCLDLMSAHETLFLMGQENAKGDGIATGPVVTNAEKAAVVMLEERLSRWTPEQAEAAALYLHPGQPTLKDLATILDITPQAVGYRVRGAGAPAIRETLKLLEPAWERRWHQ